MQQWRAIPGHPAYEINSGGRIRKADTHYTITVKGRLVRLSTGGAIVRCLVADLVTAAFQPPTTRASIPPRSSRKGTRITRLNPRASVAPRSTTKAMPQELKEAIMRSEKAPSEKKARIKPAGFYKPVRSHGTPPRMNLDQCPWATARIEGTAMGADPVLGF